MIGSSPTSDASLTAWYPILLYFSAAWEATLKVLPEVVHTTPEGFYSVAYGNITALLIEAIKEEKLKRETLEMRIEQLEKILKEK